MTLQPVAKVVFQERLEEDEKKPAPSVRPAFGINWRRPGSNQDGAFFTGEVEASFDEEEGESTEASLRVWNLSPELRQRIKSNGFMRIEAGWENQHLPQSHIMFHGQIQEMTSEISGSEHITEIAATTGGPRYEQVYVPLRRKNQSIRDIIEDIVEAIGGTIARPLPKGFDTKVNYLTTEPVWKELTKLTQIASDQAGRPYAIIRLPTAPFSLAIIDVGKARNKENFGLRVLGPIRADKSYVVRAAQTQLTGSSSQSLSVSSGSTRPQANQQGAIVDNSTAQQGYEATILLQPQVTLGTHAIITHSPNGAGRFVVREVTHRFGGANSDSWETDMTGPRSMKLFIDRGEPKQDPNVPDLQTLEG